MSAFRVLNQKPIYYDTTNPDGPVVCSGGSLNFYITGTSTPADVYSDEGLSVNIGPTVTLDALGQQEYDIWGDIEYRVILKNSAGVTVWQLDNVRDVATGGLSIPALESGKFLSNDGSLLLWDDVLQVPDTTGNSGKILGTDGTSPIWQSIASLNIPTVTVASTSLKLGTKLIQWGTGTATATGSRQTSVSVTFATAYDSTPDIVIPVCTAASVASYTQGVMPSVTSKSTTGFTVQWTAGEIDDSQSGYNITSNVTFDYVVIGTKA